MSVTKSKTLDTLATKYATLKHQIKSLETQLKSISNELLIDMHPGDAIETPEYVVSCFAGKSSKFWTEAGKKHKAAFEDELIEQGYMDVKVGDKFVQVRFRKETDVDNE